MNYLKIYNQLIESRKKLKRQLNYTECHHILPRCMGGNDNKDNLIDLTAREHFIAHWLLWKEYRTKELGCAFGLMRKSKDDLKVTSIKYEISRKALSESTSNYMTGLTKENSEMRRKAAKSLSLSLHNKDTFEFYHKEYGHYKGTCFDLKKKYPDQNLNSGNLLKVGRGEFNHSKGWILFSNKEKYDIIVFETKLNNSSNAGKKGGKYKHVNNGKTSTRIPECKVGQFLMENPDWKMGCLTTKNSNKRIKCNVCGKETTVQWFKRIHKDCK